MKQHQEDVENWSENEEISSGQGNLSTVDKPRVDDTPKSSRKRRSKYDILEENWNKQFSTLSSKVDKLLDSMLSQRQTSEASKSKKRRLEEIYTDSDSEIENSVHSHKLQDDVLSLQANSIFSDENSDQEIVVSKRQKNDSTGVNCESEKNVSVVNDDTLKLPETARKGLYDIFGEDALVHREEKKDGIKLDTSQKEVLNSSYRSQTPNTLTAFCEDVFDQFPIDDETEKFLQVPSLEPLVESCIIKRHGQKASFGKNKQKTLFSQPSKMVEKIAYKGQQAARLGIVMQLYIQQSLGNLMNIISSENDKDRLVENVKSIFAMTTKCLDQLGRAGAFHHIIRRAVAMTDTAFYELDDALEFSNLPLTGEGIFGTGLENLLKTRKEKKKQIDELVPDVQKSKRSTSGHSDYRKPRYEKQPLSSSNLKPQGSLDNFRIPKIPKQKFDTRREYRKNGSYSRSFGRRSETSAYTDRKNDKPVNK